MAAYHDGAFAVAPMMDYTNQFLRFLLRRITAKSTLYTEMVTANTIVHCGESELPRFLDHDGEAEQPLVLQVGGADPEMLRRAAEIAEPWGFTALNLNCGCPSDRVAGSGCFGAALMREPKLVADCCAALADGASGRLPVTVKCRIGVTNDKANAAKVDDEATYAELAQFVDTVSREGNVRNFIVHARKAVLGGLSPAQNRQVPPLRYNLVHKLSREFPELYFSLNGGVDTMDQASHHLRYDDSDGSSKLSGVMSGRSVIARPWDFATVDTQLYRASSDPATSRRQVLNAYAEYCDATEARIPQRVRHLLIASAVNLFAGEPHGKQFRRAVDQHGKGIPAAQVLLNAAEEALLPETLDAPPGHQWDHRERAYLSREEWLRVGAERASEKLAEESAAAAAAATG